MRDFIVVSETYVEELEKRVQYLIEQGYVAHGSIAITDEKLVQPMVSKDYMHKITTKATKDAVDWCYICLNRSNTGNG